MSNLDFIYGNSYPVSKEDFRTAVELWQRQGHEHVVKTEFDDVTGKIILVVQDYINPQDSFYLEATPWTAEESYYAQ
jgi:hypothetical protein